MSESIVREAVKEHREQLCRLIDVLLSERDALESLRSRLCAALGLPADSAPEMVAEALNHTALVGRIAGRPECPACHGTGDVGGNAIGCYHCGGEG